MMKDDDDNNDDDDDNGLNLSPAILFWTSNGDDGCSVVGTKFVVIQIQRILPRYFKDFRANEAFSGEGHAIEEAL